MLSTTKFWVWLSITGELPAAWALLRRFGQPEQVYYASAQELAEVRGLSPRALAPFAEKSNRRTEEILAACDRLGVQILTWQDADYPEQLRSLPCPPMVLYLLGRPLRLSSACLIAMAGTRRCSSYGRQMAERFARELTRLGAVVLTGMAGGCDEAALMGAMREGGPVAALLPGGVDEPFEPSPYYRQLYRNVAELGVLISTYPPGTTNDHRHFRSRNAVLTGLSAATLIVEAGSRSGALSVAANALEQQRPLYTIPANLTALSAAGTNGLLVSGQALAVGCARDILENLGPAYPSLGRDRAPLQPIPARETPPRKTSAPAPAKEERPAGNAQKKVDSGAKVDYIDLQRGEPPFNEDETVILRCLSSGEKTGEELFAAAGLPMERLMAELTILTLQGDVEERSGGRFALAAPLKEA